VAGAHGVSQAHLGAFMAAARRHERALALTLQTTEALVSQTAKEHVAVHLDQLLGLEVEFEGCQPLTGIADQANRLVGERLKALRIANHAGLPADENLCQTAKVACTG